MQKDFKTVHSIGITGGIGSGKSKVCRQLARICNLPEINLDMICRQLLQKDEPGWQALTTVVDASLFLPDGELDRKGFRQALFSDNELRARVDAVIHPLARSATAALIAASDSMVLVEIPLLYEVGWHDDVDLVVVVYALPEVCRQRIMERDCVSAKEAGLAMDAQYSLEKKKENGDVVIDNSGAWQNTCTQIQDLAEWLCCNEIKEKRHDKL